MKLMKAILVLVALSACPGMQAQGGTGSEEAHIRQLQVQQAEAWKRHDAAAHGSLFTEDGDVVNVVGWCRNSEFLADDSRSS